MQLIRGALERLSRRVILRSRLPTRFGFFPLLTSPDARLGFWRRNVETVDARLLSVVEEYVSPGSVVWDIGANVGVFSLASAARAGASGRVLAVEGDTWLVDLLRRTCRMSSDPRAVIDVLPAVVDADLGIAAFNIAERGRAANFLEGVGSTQTGGTRESQRVVSVTLDWLLGFFPAPNLVKIDVEGAELRALQGASIMLSKVRPILICEVSQSNTKEVSHMLSSHGYVLHDMDDTGRPPAVIGIATNNTIAIPSSDRR